MGIPRKKFERMIAFVCAIAFVFAGLVENPAFTQAKFFAKAKKQKTVSLSKKKVTLKVGGTYKLVVKNAPKAKISFQSSRKAVATVSKKGKIKAKKAGTTIIKCKVKYRKNGSGKKVSKTLKCSVRVTAKKKITTVPTATAVVSSTVPTQKPAARPTASTAPTASAEPTLAPTKEPGGSPVTPAQTYASSYKGMDANNPLLANSFACDPTAIEYNGRVYVYMTNDSQEYAAQGKDGENYYGFITSMHVISSDDMVNWTDHGIVNISGKEGIDGNSTGCCWAPCAAYKKINGEDKFFLYYTNGGAMIGVAVADSPIGPFRNERGSYLINPWGDEEEMSGADALDPAVFTDDDGTSYLVWGGDCARGPEEKHYPRIRRLADDMISFAGEEAVIQAPYFFEDSGINKIGNKYIFSYCTDWNARSEEYKDLGLCSIAYMEADSPMGPYRYVGEVLPNCGEVFKKADGSDDSGNNHHSIMKFGDNYYMFYHTMVLRTSMEIHFGGRSTQVNKLSINPDGTLEMVNQDLEGVPQLGTLDPYQEVLGLTSSNNAGMQVIDSSVVFKKNGEVNYVIPANGAQMRAVESRSDYLYSWLSVKGVDFGDTAPTTFTAKLKGYGMDKIKLKVCADALDGKEIVNTEVSFDEYGEAIVSVPSEALTGIHDLFIEFDGAVHSFVSWRFI